MAKRMADPYGPEVRWLKIKNRAYTRWRGVRSCSIPANCGVLFEGASTMGNPTGNLLRCPKCQATIDLSHAYSWCMSCGQLLPPEIVNHVPNVPAALAAASAAGTQPGAADRAPIVDLRESRGPLTCLG